MTGASSSVEPLADEIGVLALTPLQWLVVEAPRSIRHLGARLSENKKASPHPGAEGGLDTGHSVSPVETLHGTPS